MGSTQYHSRAFALANGRKCCFEVQFFLAEVAILLANGDIGNTIYCDTFKRLLYEQVSPRMMVGG
jgi:hypothetical protein